MLALTIDTKFQCLHGMKFGVQVSAPPMVQLGASKVLTCKSLLSAMIMGSCGAPPSPVVKPCTKILMVSSGICAWAAVGSDPILTDQTMGLTDGILGGSPTQFMVSDPCQQFVSLAP